MEKNRRNEIPIRSTAYKIHAYMHMYVYCVVHKRITMVMCAARVNKHVAVIFTDTIVYPSGHTPGLNAINVVVVLLSFVDLINTPTIWYTWSI